jgi:long-chain acyl-CoA synthetase
MLEVHGQPIAVFQTPVHVAIEQVVERYPRNAALAFRDRSITYAELGALVRRLAAGLQARGVAKGDRVAVVLPTCPQFTLCVLACMHAGAIVINNMSPLFADRELEKQIDDGTPRVLVVLDSLAERARRIARAKGVSLVIAASLDGGSDLDELLGHDGPLTPVECDLDDVAVLQYTGGTSGVFRGAMLSHRNLAAMIQASRVWTGWKEGNERCLLALPTSHIYCFTVGLLAHLVNGSTILHMPEFRITEVAAALNQFQPTWLPGVPRFFHEMIEYRKAGGAIDLSSARQIISGAAPLPGEIWDEFRAVFGQVLYEGYGCSECSPVITCNPMIDGRPAKRDSVGVPFPNTTVRIGPTPDGDPASGVGEVLVKGPQVMQGFWRSPELSAEALKDGWLHTGDLGRLDEDGYLYLVGRSKEMMCVAGFNVYNAEVEEVIREHPKVSDACVLGIPHPTLCETVAAYVVPRPGEQISQPELVRHCRERLAKYKVPRVVKLVEQLPQLGSSKQTRQALLDQHLTKLNG